MDEEKEHWENEPITREIPKVEEEKKPEQDTRKVRTCPYCKQEYKIKTGLENWKNLFRKPTIDDWISLFILLLLFAAAYAYINETKQCKDMVANFGQMCAQYQKDILNMTRTETSINQAFPINFSLVENTTTETTTNTTTETTTNITNASGQIIGGENDQQEVNITNNTNMNLTVLNNSNASVR